MSPSYYMMSANVLPVAEASQHVDVAAASWPDMAVESWRYRFECDWRSFVDSDSAPVRAVSLGDIRVLTGLFYIGGRIIVSDLPFQKLADYLSNVPPDTSRSQSTVAAASATKGPAKTGKHHDNLVNEFAWAKVGLDKLFQFGDKRDAGEVVLPVDEDVADFDLDDDALEDMVHDMQRQRLDLAAAGDERTWDDFKVSIIVRSNRPDQTGSIVQGVIANSRNETAEQFCIDNGKPKTATLHYAVHGDDVANILARAWCHRMQHYFNVAISRGSLHQDFSVADIAFYEAPTEFERLLEAPYRAAVARRVDQIRNSF